MIINIIFIYYALSIISIIYESITGITVLNNLFLYLFFYLFLDLFLV